MKIRIYGVVVAAGLLFAGPVLADDACESLKLQQALALVPQTDCGSAGYVRGFLEVRNSPGGSGSSHATLFRTGPSKNADGSDHGGGMGAHPITPRKGD